MNRTRRLRKTPVIRNLIQENHLQKNDLVAPIFITAGSGIENEVISMPGVFRFSLDTIEKELDSLDTLGLHSVMLFGVPAEKDAVGSDSFSDEGIIQQAIRFIKARYPHFYVMTDVCFCEYTDHGHCGVLDGENVHNDQTLENLSKQALSHARAGADMIAPSGMMDGVIATLRKTLDSAGFTELPIMGYSVKYASAFYGPFRDAVDATPSFGDRKTYQMNPANSREAMIEAHFDISEGVDVLLVKPALAYLDVIHALKQKTNHPIACYNVSGEYAMIKAAAEKGWIDEEKVMMESLLSMKRAGADIIITYFAKQAAMLLQN